MRFTQTEWTNSIVVRGIVLIFGHRHRLAAGRENISYATLATPNIFVQQLETYTIRRRIGSQAQWPHRRSLRGQCQKWNHELPSGNLRAPSALPSTADMARHSIPLVGAGENLGDDDRTACSTGAPQPDSCNPANSIFMNGPGRCSANGRRIACQLSKTNIEEMQMVGIQVVKPSDIESTTMSKVTWRLVPFLMLCYFIAYLDRVNIGFAGATMRADLNLSATAFGGAAGIFFLAYFFFEVPSNLALNAFGARRWIARIMFTWGIISGAQAFVSGELSFNIVRLLLGVAEAGFFPGIIFFLTLWFPTAYRARIVGWFMFAIPISTVIGAPISGLTLSLEGVAGLHGWQWMFLIEGFPALIMTFAVLYYLTDRPIDANWLEPQEREWLQGRLNRERAERLRILDLSWFRSMMDWRVRSSGPYRRHF